MKFLTYWKLLNPEQKTQLALSVNTSVPFLSQIAYRHRSCSETLALAIERETAGQVTVAELRPQFAADLERSGYLRKASCPVCSNQPQPKLGDPP